MGRTTQMHIAAIQADVDAWAADMAVKLAEAQAKQDADKHTARIAALVSTAGIAAANIHLSRMTPNRKLTRNELLLSAAQADLDSLAADIKNAIENGTPIPTASPAPVSAPVPKRLGTWATFRKAYSDGYHATY